MIEIAASILTADQTALGAELETVATATAIHVDVMDGHFVPNFAYGPAAVEAIRRSTTLPIEVHLMIDDPDRHLQTFIAAGADVVIVHAEASRHLDRSLGQIRELGAKAGVALSPETGLAGIRFVLDRIDHLLVMTVNPGFGGQAFIDAMVPKISAARRILGDRIATIEVDGGVGFDQVRRCYTAGADRAAVGSLLFNARDRAETIRELRAASQP